MKISLTLAFYLLTGTAMLADRPAHSHASGNLLS
jgi:hypothetical protein